MDAKRQCSVCAADLSAAASPLGAPQGPRRVFYAGREHLFCAGMACIRSFKRSPEAFAAGGVAVVAAGPPPAAPKRQGAPLFQVRRTASAADEPESP